MKNLLVTGGAGFIGSNLILHLLRTRTDVRIWNVDKLTYASDLSYLKPVEQDPRYRFIKADIADRKQVHAFIQEVQPDGVIHLAAESHVDNSIAGPEPFVLTNVVGTFNLLEECRQYWKASGKFAEARFHHVSTDEVYGTLGATGLFTEETPYAPNSPYSASKAGSDHLVRAYHHTYGMNTVMTNCSNNYGPHQHAEKLIPTVIRKALAHQPIPVYGKGENVRDWLFVEDHCRAIDLVFHQGRNGESYNVGGRNEWTNINLVREICRLMDQITGKGPIGGYAALISFVTDRPGHDLRYAIDATKLETELGWRNTQDFSADLKKTVAWFIQKFGAA